MFRALTTAATGMNVQEKKINIIANNLANVNTDGFKKSRGDFQDLIYTDEKTAGTVNANEARLPTGLSVGHGAVLASTSRLHTTGEIKSTGGPLDLAIEGRGYFQVQLPTGEMGYTRAGNLKKNSEGQLVTADGYQIQPNITIPQDAVNVTIGNDGTVSVLQSGQTSPQEVGKIELAIFSSDQGLRAIGKNIYLPTEASGQPVTGQPGQNGIGSLLQAHLEKANVSVVEEMIEMIVSQRAYEVNSKTIQAADEMLGKVANLKR
ncbi:MAG: flagellar basal-body rod protein FlgG [Deltaproteobacteria bacterium]|nr:flagellar basal-body rod protein FlgG [Deltaproteobacteria bacterium]